MNALLHKGRGAVLALATFMFAAAGTGVSAHAAKSRGAIDYFTAPFEIHRVLDWGTRPDWSPDGRKIAFTESDVRDTNAHELDLRSGKVRCLTCKLGDHWLVTRVYYLPDGSFLLLAPRRRGPAAASNFDDVVSQQLYWMPATADSEPVALGAPAFGEIAISLTIGRDGRVALAWGELRGRQWVINVAALAHDGVTAALSDRRIVYDSTQAKGTAGAGMAETYGFANGDTAIDFFTITAGSGTLNGEMYQVDIATGALRNMSRDPHHNETHRFPDERIGLEESNRATDPSGAWRGISVFSAKTIRIIGANNGVAVPDEKTLEAYAPYRGMTGLDRPFDLFVTTVDGSARTRNLTKVSDMGSKDHQSVAAPDGRRIVFTLEAQDSGPLAGKSGLYIGEFSPAKH